MAFRSRFQILELFNKNPAVRIGSVCLLFLEIQNIVPEFLRKNGMIYCVSVLLQSVVTTVFMCSDLNSWGIFSSLTLCINCTSLSDINNINDGVFFSVYEDKILGMRECSVHLPLSAFCLFSHDQDAGMTSVIINIIWF